MSEPPEPRGIPIVWVGVEDLVVLFANQTVIQHVVRGEFVLTFGQLTPPVILGDDEAKARQAEAVSYIGVKPVARVSLSRSRLQELIRVLQENLETHDRTFKIEDES